jgi:hypothetical protein
MASPSTMPLTHQPGKAGALLTALINAYLRRRRPLHDHSFLVLTGHGLAFGRCPNAASEGIRTALLRLAGAPAGMAGRPRYATGTLSSWTDGLTLLSGRQLTRLHPQALVFTVVRDPLTRAASCFDKLERGVTPPSEHDPVLVNGLDFARFVSRICATPDWRSANAYRSQTSILAHKNRLLPTRVLRYETADADWEALRWDVAARSDADIGPLPAIADAGEQRIAELAGGLDPALRLALRRRYAADYRAFYEGTDLAVPVTGSATGP